MFPIQPQAVEYNKKRNEELNVMQYLLCLLGSDHLRSLVEYLIFCSIKGNSFWHDNCYWLMLCACFLQLTPLCLPFSSAYDVRTALKVAVKKLSRPFQSIIHAKRTYRELRLLKHMKHENVSHLQPTHTPTSNPPVSVSPPFMCCSVL